MQLSRLIWTSRRNPDEKLDMMRLIQQSVSANQQDYVTGLLWYDGQHFIQVLEGGREIVSELYLRIAQDPRHFDVRLISVEDIDVREFEEWAMGLAYDGSDGANLGKHIKYSPHKDVEPSQLRAGSVLNLLKECRENL